MIGMGDMEQVQKLINQLGKEIRILIRQAIEISYFSRGAISYYDVLNMSAGERDIATDFLEDRLKQASKMPFPVY